LDSIGTSFGQSFIKTMTSLSMFLTPNLHLCKDVKTPFMFKILFVSICDFDIPSTWHVTLGNWASWAFPCVRSKLHSFKCTWKW
jgi:hypothetical protein